MNRSLKQWIIFHNSAQIELISKLLTRWNKTFLSKVKFQLFENHNRNDIVALSTEYRLEISNCRWMAVQGNQKNVSEKLRWWSKYFMLSNIQSWWQKKFWKKKRNHSMSHDHSKYITKQKQNRIEEEYLETCATTTICFAFKWIFFHYVSIDNPWLVSIECVSWFC